MKERERGNEGKVKKQEQPRGRNADSVLRLCQVMIAQIQSQKRMEREREDQKNVMPGLWIYCKF